MTSETQQPLAEFTRSVAEACRALRGFEATQTVEAGPIRAVAHVRFHRPDRLDLEYQTYVNPVLELEEQLTGDSDYTPNELVGLSLHADGQRTTVCDASTGVCVVKPERSLYEPIPELALLGEVEYLRDLPHDYLLRDTGEEPIDGRTARVLALKPKHEHRAYAFKIVAFLASRASVALDRETLFPLRLEIHPAPFAQARRLLGPDGRIVVRFSGVRLVSDPPPSFAPPEGTRVFREEHIALDELAVRLPYALSTDAFREARFEPIDSRALLVEDAERRRAYCSVGFVRPEGAVDQPPGLITLRCGNYLSRNMSRRRATVADLGQELAVAGRPARYYDRQPQWEKHAAGLNPSQASRELVWENNGVFWFLTAVNIEQADLVRLASALMAPRA